MPKKEYDWLYYGLQTEYKIWPKVGEHLTVHVNFFLNLVQLS